MQPWGTRKIDPENVNKGFMVITSQQQQARKIKSFQIILAPPDQKKISLEKVLTETTDDDINIIINFNILKVFQMYACFPECNGSNCFCKL